MGIQYEYTPKACQDGDFEGSVTLEGLHFERKMKMLDELDKQGISISEMSKMGEGESDPMKAIRVMNQFVLKTKDLWKSCDLKDKSTGIEMKSYDDVASYPKAHNILLDVSMHIMGGGLGN